MSQPAIQLPIRLAAQVAGPVELIDAIGPVFIIGTAERLVHVKVGQLNGQVVLIEVVTHRSVGRFPKRLAQLHGVPLMIAYNDQERSSNVSLDRTVMWR